MRTLTILFLFSTQFLFAQEGVFTSLTEALAKPDEVKTLLLSGKNIPQLPVTFINLINLEYLDLSNNQLKKIPKELFVLNRLKAVNLKGNQIQQIDSEIGQLENLEALYINQKLNGNWQETKFIATSLPKELFQLCNLKTLEVGNFGLTSLPPEIINSNIEELYLFNNLMHEVPAEVFAMGSLKLLDVSNNQIDQLPENIGYSKALKILNLNGNKLTHIPDSIVTLPKLVYLHLAANPLQNANEEIKKAFGCSRLAYLNLSALNISIVDDAIGDLKRIDELDLSYNRIMSLPESIGNLHRATKFSLQRNNLKDLPARMDELKQLQILDVSYNEFTLFPKSITALEELQNVDISFNPRMTNFPAEVYNMNGLRMINLRKTGLNSAQQSKFRDSLISCNFIL